MVQLVLILAGFAVLLISCVAIVAADDKHLITAYAVAAVAVGSIAVGVFTSTDTWTPNTNHVPAHLSP